MKKLLLIALFLLLVVAGSAIWIWRMIGITDAAVLLPAQTVLLTSLPDLARTAIVRWPGTSLAKIAGEPEFKAFLEKPLSQLSNNKGGSEAGDILLKLKPGRLFAAITSINPQQANVLVGFQFWGGQGNYDASVARLREELAKGQPAQPAQTVEYNGNTITSTGYGTGALFSAAEGHWGFLSNNLETIKDAMDRASGRVKENSLADNPQYREVVARLLPSPDFLLFAQPKGFVDTLLAIGQSVGAQPDPEQVKQLQAVQAIGSSMKIDGENFRDSLFILRPNPPQMGELKHAAIKLTSSDTIAYFDFLTNFKNLASLRSNPAFASLLNTPAFQNSKIIDLAPEAFGPECALSLTWDPQQMIPKALLAIQVKDKAKAEECLQEIVALFPEATVSEWEGIRYYSFPALQSLFANPTVSLDEGFLLTGLTEGDVQRGMQAARKNEGLEKSPAFAAALPAYRQANEVFGYVDSRAIFERAYTTLKPALQFGAQVMPGMAEWIDTSKLPQLETVAKHLDPIVYTQSRVDNGYLVESTGPITLNQAVLIGLGTSSQFLPGARPR